MIDIKPYLRWLVPVVLVIAGILSLWWYGAHQYAKGRDAGIAWQKQEQAKVNEKTRADREAEKERLEKQHAVEAAALRVDADAARNAADGLRAQLNRIRRLSADYSATVGLGATGDTTVLLLADVLEKSVERNRQLAEYADRARAGGQLCERSYDALRNKPR